MNDEDEARYKFYRSAVLCALQVRHAACYIHTPHIHAHTHCILGGRVSRHVHVRATHGQHLPNVLHIKAQDAARIQGIR